ncbi:unnamed protein product, partial [Meganyctiphanes norvegica]
GGGKQHQNGKKMPLDMKEDEIDPLKLFVGNLKKGVNKDQLLATLTPHANVTSACIVKKKFKGPNYGFISLLSEDDVNKIMNLNNQECYLSGSKLIFRPARRRCMLPGEEGFVRQALPDRDYDLDPLDPEKTSIHILVDDVMLKILEYLTLKERICCEVVCRRWQALVYRIFESRCLNLDESYLIQNNVNVNKAMISKMLLLAGETLKSLSLSKTDVSCYLKIDNDTEIALKKNLSLIISQLCPNLEYLDVADLCLNNVKALKDCNNIKGFSSSKCYELTENSFKELILVLPCLEKINVSYTNINGDCFNLLPEGLKELNISFCSQVSKKNLNKIIKRCKNLEVLEIEDLYIDREFLEELVGNCTNLRNLSITHLSDGEISDQIKLFTKLTNLKILATTFDLPNIADTVKNLEELRITIINKTTTNMIDFGHFIHLKCVVLTLTPFCKQELMSLEKCKKLQYVTIYGCNADQELIKNIIKGCPDIKHIKCPKVCIDMKFITDINEIMKNRSEPIKIAVDEGDLPSSEELVAQYDTKKIYFDFVENSHSDEYFDFDYDDDGDSVDYDFYDSGDDFYDPDDIDNFLFNGYDSDNSLQGNIYLGDWGF